MSDDGFEKLGDQISSLRDQLVETRLEITAFRGNVRELNRSVDRAEADIVRVNALVERLDKSLRDGVRGEVEKLSLLVVEQRLPERVVELEMDSGREKVFAAGLGAGAGAIAAWISKLLSVVASP